MRDIIIVEDKGHGKPVVVRLDRVSSDGPWCNVQGAVVESGLLVDISEPVAEDGLGAMSNSGAFWLVGSDAYFLGAVSDDGNECFCVGNPGATDADNVILDHTKLPLVRIKGVKYRVAVNGYPMGCEYARRSNAKAHANRLVVQCGADASVVCVINFDIQKNFEEE